MSNSNVSIISAIFTSASKGTDVTAKVTELVSGGNDDFAVNTATFGEPDPGKPKFFSVVYSATGLNGDNPVVLAAREGTVVDLVPRKPVAAGQFCTPPQQPLARVSGCPTILRAAYGTTVNGFDVTAICQAIVNQGGDGRGRYVIPVSNLTFGGDPDLGTPKIFVIGYEFHLPPFGGLLTAFASATEGQNVTLSL